MRLILIFVLVLGLGCGDREKPVSVEPSGKASTDCSLADILAGRCGDTADPTLDEVPENYVPPSPSTPADSTEAAVTDSTATGDAGGDADAGDDGDAGDDTGSDDTAAEEPEEPDAPVVVVEEPEAEEPVERTVFEKACDEIGRSAVRLAELSAPHGDSRSSSVSLEHGAWLRPSGAYGTVTLSWYNRPAGDGEFRLEGELRLVGSRGVSSGVVTVYDADNAGQGALYLLGVSFRVRHARSDFEVYNGHCGDLGTLVLKKVITGSFNLLNLLSRDAQFAFEDYQNIPTGSGQGSLDYDFTGRLSRQIEYGYSSSRYRYYNRFYYDNRSSIGVRGTASAAYEEAKPFPVEVSGSFEIDPRNVLGTLLFPNPGPWPNTIPNMLRLESIWVSVDAYFHNRKAVSPSGTVGLNTIRSQIGPIQNHSDTDFEYAAMDTVFVSAGIE